MLQLIVGLGNPGAEYAGSRHNVGFFWIDRLAEEARAQFKSERRFKGLVARAEIGGRELLLLKPQTYMNASGESVAPLARFYKFTPEQILVVHDEMDLPAGHVKLKHGGGHAGHNGLRDIQAQLGSAATWRLRLGIGHPPSREQVIGWVLGRPIATALDAIKDAVRRSLDALPDLVAGRVDRATQAIHGGNPAA
jgi:PTH1 family peptidyl-tRNA hydrolase